MNYLLMAEIAEEAAVYVDETNFYSCIAIHMACGLKCPEAQKGGFSFNPIVRAYANFMGFETHAPIEQHFPDEMLLFSEWKETRVLCLLLFAEAMRDLAARPS